METYDVRCPICGHINKNRYLEESEGWIECESCQNVTNLYILERETYKIPVISMEALGRMVSSGK